MKTNNTLELTAAIIMTIIISCSNIFAQTPGSSDSASAFNFNFMQRYRIETWDNASTLSKAAKAGTSYLRVRTSVAGDWAPDQTVDVALKLTHEFRTYFAPSTNDFHLNEVFVDQLYLKWNTKSFLNGTLTVGRQNITFGEGFLVTEGSPLDGSRSVYFNAARYDWNINKNNTITIFGIYQPKTDNLLPVINGNDIDAAYEVDGTYSLAEQNVSGGGIYYTGQMANSNLQSYYLLKSYIKPDKSLGQVKSDVHTVGGRFNTKIFPALSTTAEAAYQFGSYGDYNRSAYGGYWYFDVNSGWLQSYLPKVFTVGTICLSGDKPGTKDMEGWDPLFSRYPKWSESYVYTLIKEQGGKVAYWSNFLSIYSSIKFKFSDNISANFDYHHLLAPQSQSKSAFLSGAGDDRGDLFIYKLVYTISKNVTGHFIWEHFIPGSYYFGGADPYNWSRMEVLISL